MVQDKNMPDNISDIEKDLNYIKKIVQRSRKNVVSNGAAMFFAGIYSFSGSIVSYFLGFMGLEKLIGKFWIFYTIIFIIFLTVYGFKKRKVKKTYSIYEKIVNSTWLMVDLAILLSFFISIIFKTISLSVELGNLSVLLGIGYFVTSVATKSNLLRIISFGWYMVAGILYVWDMYFESLYSPLFFSFFILLFVIIPGIIEYKKWIKREF